MSESRYPRTTGGLVGAIVVTVLAVLALVALRGLARDNPPTPVRTVDYEPMLRAARDDGQLVVLVPSTLPPGWRATSASYDGGPTPTWHLGLLTEGRQYVGMEESRDSPQEMARSHVDEDATRDGSVRIEGRTWQVWRDAGGDYAVVRTFPGPRRSTETVLVVGSAPDEQVRRLAASLEVPGPEAGS